jgi:hypothetical protein
MRVGTALDGGSRGQHDESEPLVALPELQAEIDYTLVNPVTNQTFFTAGPEVTYWLAKWMSSWSYSNYQQDQGPRWPNLPASFPGNSLTPLNPPATGSTTQSTESRTRAGDSPTWPAEDWPGSRWGLSHHN